MGMNRRLIGRKLYVKWGKNMYIAIEKIPDGFKKLAEIETVSKEGLELCNVYETENGEKEEEIIGAPYNDRNGYTVDFIFQNPDFWKTAAEKLEENKILDEDNNETSIHNS